jgi:hypothetical protein
VVAELKGLYDDLNFDGLRVSRPSKFVFFCGGAIPLQENARAKNLRDYLCRVKPIHLGYDLILAEKAVQLYRDTDYHDLISFEEDIARIASVVLVIAESEGSLAELGAFSANETISTVLRVVIQEEHEKAESFVRYGPIQRVKNLSRSYLGVYPWRVRRTGNLVISTVQPHLREIKDFIAQHVSAIPVSTTYAQISKFRLFYFVYWVIYLCLAVEVKHLCSYVRLIVPDATDEEISNKVYCMKIAGWLERIAYSGKDYVYAKHDVDPLDYSFKPNVSNRDSVRRKIAVTTALRKAEAVPKHVRTVAAEARI